MVVLGEGGLSYERDTPVDSLKPLNVASVGAFRAQIPMLSRNCQFPRREGGLARYRGTSLRRNVQPPRNPMRAKVPLYHHQCARRERDLSHYRGTSLVRKRTPLGPYRRPLPRFIGGSYGGGRFLMGELRLYPHSGDATQRSTTGGHEYRGTSLIRNRHTVGLNSRTMPRLIWRS